MRQPNRRGRCGEHARRGGRPLTPQRRYAGEGRCGASGENARWSVGGVGKETDGVNSRWKKKGGTCRRRGNHKRLQCRCRGSAACGSRSAVSGRRLRRMHACRRGAAFLRRALRAGDQHRVRVPITHDAGGYPLGRPPCGHGHAAAKGHCSDCIPAKGKRQHDYPDERRSKCSIHSARV